MADMCGNCNAYLKGNEQKGWCRARPPVPLVVGIQPPRIAGQNPEPIIQALFPPMAHDSWCREHEAANVELSKIDLSSLRDTLAEGSA